MAKVATEETVVDVQAIPVVTIDEPNVLQEYEERLQERNEEIDRLNQKLELHEIGDELIFQEVYKMADELSDAHIKLDEFESKRTKELAITLGVGVTTVGAIGILAYLRERKVRKHIVQMIEDYAVALLDFQSNKESGIELSVFCTKVSNTILETRVRSLTRPFGIKYEEAKHVVSLLNSLVIHVDQIKTNDLNLSPVNPEDIVAQVTTHPTEPEKKEGK